MSDGPHNPIPLEIPPGIIKTKSAYAGKGRWTDCDHIRFEDDLPQKWLGWQKFIPEQLQGIARGASSWTNRYGNTNIAIGTNLKLYAIIGNSDLRDITPLRDEAQLTDPFAVTEDEVTVIVTHTTHNAAIGDYVRYANATAVGGITIDGEYIVTSVIDPDNYTIEHALPATSTATGGGSVDVAYQISVAPAGTVYGLGWGAGPWGEEEWGTERAQGLEIEGRYWSIREYGNESLYSPSGGALYLWEEQTDDRAELVPGAPVAMRFMFVTGERYVFALGTTTGMTVQWPDVDDPTDWVPAPGNTANTRTLQSGSKLMGGCPLTDGVNLVWSDTSVYVFQKIESDFIYDSRLAGTACGLIGPQAFDTASGVAFWSSGRNVHMYSQGVQPIPRFGDIKEWLLRDMDPAQVAKMWCRYDQKNNQVRWGYCSRGALEPDRYFDVSLDGKWNWTIGTLDATTATPYRPFDASLLTVASDGHVYEHDRGYDADDQPLGFYLDYGLYTLARADVITDIMSFVPDYERQQGTLTHTITTFDRPQAADADTYESYDQRTFPVPVGTKIVDDLRIAGRFFTMRVASNAFGSDVRFGTNTLLLGPSGERL